MAEREAAGVALTLEAGMHFSVEVTVRAAPAPTAIPIPETQVNEGGGSTAPAQERGERRRPKELKRLERGSGRPHRRMLPEYVEPQDREL